MRDCARLCSSFRLCNTQLYPLLPNEAQTATNKGVAHNLFFVNINMCTNTYLDPGARSTSQILMGVIEAMLLRTSDEILPSTQTVVMPQFQSASNLVPLID